MMPEREKRLGRGLDSLISRAKDRLEDVQERPEASGRQRQIATDRIVPNPWQPRTDFATEPLNDLVESLRQHGLMQPIVVRERGTQFELIAGERRWRASQELGWARIEAVVVEASDRDMIEWALVENLQRDDLNPIELALSFRQLMREHDLTQSDVARIVGLSRPAVSNTMRLLELPESIQRRVSRGTLSAGAARALLAIPDTDRREEAAERAARGELTVRDIEALSGSRPSAGTKPRARSSSAPRSADEIHLRDLQRELGEILGVPVSLQGDLKQGRIQLRYEDPRILDGLIRRFRALRHTEVAEDEAPDEDEDRITV